MFATASKFAGPIILAAALLAAPPVRAEEGADAERPDCEFGEERLRRRPGRPAPDGTRCAEEGLQPAVWRPLPDLTAIPDRWRIVSSLGYPERWWDPYNGNQ